VLLVLILRHQTNQLLRSLFKKISFASCVLWAVHGFAQQRPHYSQYMLNQYLLNPAVAGTSDHYDIRMGHRTQWANLSGAPSGITPQTTYLTGHFHLGQHIGPNRGRHKNEQTDHHGIGVMVIHDKTGPTSRTSAYGSYAYHAKLTKKLKISLGASLGFQQFRVDSDKLTTSDGVTGGQGVVSQWVPDMNFGFWLYHQRYYFGAAINQIFQNKLKFSDISSNGNNKLNNHYFITGGYLIGYHTDLHFIPSLMIKYVSPAPVSFDINMKLRYRDAVWGGISYRHKDAIVGLVGVTIKRMIDVGYAYDYGISEISKMSMGSHEVMLGLRLAPQEELRSPSDFW
jgi:type IX secretion system PorP/SprF family membrane protein